MQRDEDRTRLRHMLDSAEKALMLSQSRTRQDLDDDDLFSLAMTRLLEIIGEAAKAIGPEVRAAYPQIPWRQIAGVRDRLIHGYFNVDLDVVWSILEHDLPPLATQLRIALE